MPGDDESRPPQAGSPNNDTATTASVNTEYRTPPYNDAVRRAHSRWFAEQERRDRERRGMIDPRRLRRLAVDWTRRYGEHEAEKMLVIVAALAEVRR